MAASVLRLGKLLPQHSALFVCDIQERFRPIISGMPAVIDTARRMVRAADALGLPVIVTEQYPKALGKTVPELTECLAQSTPVVEKLHFSMVVPEVADFLTRQHAIKQVLLVGIEAHVCVLQTTLDLLEKGYEVHIITDGVSSQRLTDRSVALHRLAQSGAFLATSEMTLFQLMGGSKHPEFKAISTLAKEERPPQLPALTTQLQSQL